MARLCGSSAGLCGLLAMLGLPLTAQTAEPHGWVESVRFTSDHQLIRRNHDEVTAGGARYPELTWSKSPASNAPITQTGGATRIKVQLVLAINGLDGPTPYRLQGTSPEPALCFVCAGALSPEDQQAELQAGAPLGKGVRTIRQPIRWRLTLHPDSAHERRIELGTTGPHVIHVTLGQPRVSDDPRTVVTDKRMALAIERVAAAQERAGLSASSPWLLWHLMQQCSTAYLPSRHYGRDLAWRVPETWTMQPPGASCISIVEFVSLVWNIIGGEGQASMAALYARADQPAKALRGGLGDPPITRRTPSGETWQLFLTDENNTNKGQPGGQGGMNYYEAALELDWRGKKFYYPGGTDRVYDSPDMVLSIFRTLAWAAYDFQRDAWVVREVVHTYTLPGQKQAESVPLPR